MRSRAESFSVALFVCDCGRANDQLIADVDLDGLVGDLLFDCGAAAPSRQVPGIELGGLGLWSLMPTGTAGRTVLPRWRHSQRRTRLCPLGPVTVTAGGGK